MTKSMFLANLNFQLLLRVPSAKRKEILRDYKDFFAEGTITGESEAALCAKFGAPHNIASEISDGEFNKGLFSYAAIIAFVMFLLIYLIPSELNLFVSLSYRYAITIFGFIITAFCASAKPNTFSKKSLVAVITSFLISLAIFIGFNIFVFQSFNILATLSAKHSGNYFAVIYYISSFALLVSLSIILSQIKKISKKALPLIPLLFFMFLSMCSLIEMFANMSDISMFVPTQVLVTSALFTTPALLLSLFFTFKKGKV